MRFYRSLGCLVTLLLRSPWQSQAPMEAGSFHLQRVAAAFGGELRLFHLVAIEGQPPSASGRNVSSPIVAAKP